MNIKEIKELVKMLDGTDVTEFSYENEGNKVLIKKGLVGLSNLSPHLTPVMQAPQVNSSYLTANPSPVMPAVEEKNEGLGPNQVLIVAPMVGTFYRSPSPEAESYVQRGQSVEVGQVVCIIEAMKLMNEIESEWRGKIVEVLAENVQPVEFGQPLFVLEKI